MWVKPNMLRKYKMPPADDALIYCIQDLFYKFLRFIMNKNVIIYTVHYVDFVIVLNLF